MGETRKPKGGAVANPDAAGLREVAPLDLSQANRKVILADLDLEDRASVVNFGESAQARVADFADRILAETRNKEMGKTGDLLADILGKARGLDASGIAEGNFLTRLFSSTEARVRRFAEKFEDVAGQIDRITIELDKHREGLRRDIAMLDDLHAQSRAAIDALDAYIEAGSRYGAEFRVTRLEALKAEAEASAGTSAGLLAAQTYQDALQALDRLEKRVMYLRQARQIALQQLPQIRIVQAGDETLIENLQATIELTIPVWKQKMILLLGLNRQNAALSMQKTVTDATNEMLKQASQMMKTQAIAIEEQSQRGIIDIETLERTNRELVETIDGVLRVQNQGRAKRAEVERKLDAMSLDLKQTLLRLPG
jgi:uncharacterized protein YaaN involved in tellurite resistance